MRSRAEPTRFSPNIGALCGAGPTECSGQDTCNAEGQCAPNDVDNETSCGNALFCIDGRCTGCGDAEAPDSLCARQSAETPFFLGEHGTVFTGGPTDGVSPLLNLSVDATLYMAGVTLAGGAGNAIDTAPVTGLYLDDVVIRDFGNIGVSGAGEGHIRRSRISVAATALRWEPELSGSGAIILENTALGPGALVGLELLGVRSANIRYVTIAGNGTSLECGDTPGLSGQLRNSIFAGTTDLAISGAACAALNFSGNAVDQTGFGSLIGHLDSTWFRDATNSDFRLTSSGALVIGEPARFAEGDPAVDIDGTARPTDRSGVPGVDQP